MKQEVRIGAQTLAHYKVTNTGETAVTGQAVFSSDVYFLNRLPAKVDWAEVTGIVVFALGISFLCTLPPAWRASRLDPVEALRYE